LAKNTFRVKSDGQIIDVNCELAQAIGYENPQAMIEQVPRCDVLCVVPSEARFYLGSLERGEAVVNQRVRARSSDNGSVWVAINSHPVKDDNGQVIYHEGTVELQDGPPPSHDLALSSNKLLSDILRAASDFSVIATDSEGVITVFSRGSELMLGYSAEEMVGKKNATCLHLPSEIAAREQELTTELGYPVSGFEVFYKKSQAEVSETRDWTYVRKDGSKLTVSLVTTLIRSDDDQIIGYLAIAHDITKNRATERTLQESEERMRGINANLPGVAFQLNAYSTEHYEVSYVSERVTEFFGIDAKLENFFDRFVAGISKSDRNHFIDTIRQAIEKSAPWDYEGRYVKPSGEVFWFHGLSTPKHFRDYIVFDGLLLDITKRKQVEEALNKRVLALTRPLEDPGNIDFEDLFNLEDIQLLQDQFAQATGVASLITHTDGTPITAPSRFCRLCNDIIRGTPKGQKNCLRSDVVLGRLSATGPRVQPCMSGGLWDAGAGISVGGKHIASWLVGQVRDETQTEDRMRAYARRIGADEEAFIEAFREVPAMSRDRFEGVAQTLYTLASMLSRYAYQNVQQARFITEREIAEEESRQSEDRLSTVFRTVPDGIAVFQLEDGMLVDANSGYEDISGWKLSDILGKTSIDYRFWIDLSDRAWIINELREGRDVLHKECHFRRSDGAERIGAYSARPVKVGGKACMLFVIQDITERKLLEEEHRMLEQQLFQSQKMDAIGQLAGGIAHDFNNILLAVSGNAKLASMDLATEDPLQNNMSEIIRGCDRATDLVRQILLFSRPQGQGQGRQALVLSDVIKEALKLVRVTIPAMIHIDTDLDTPVPSIYADESQIHQIVVNLSTNAVQAMGEKSGQIRLSIDETTLEGDLPDIDKGHYVRLHVADNGCGMDPTTIKRIFEPFFTTKATGKGTGLGLSVVHGIMKSIEGGITVESELGKGTEFCLYFPADTQQHQIESVEPILSTKATGKGKRVLYVDDDSSLVLLIKRMLERAGYVVTGISDPIEALAIFRDNPDSIDVVATDLSMPGMSGFELAKELFATRPDISIFMTSGYVRPEDEARAKEVGIRSLILKPNTLEELRNVLDQLFSEI
jgi:PAS domain S-box-containing protein